ncbi:hypothetical protein AB4Z48_03195 [Cupriavidus sp. 2TAF22]|uniref:hypothetical protein n=1 Tax=unclassified Cupriavidus TaxID=2640874 RepID=UPI003F8E2B2A
MALPSLPHAADSIGSALRLCTARRADQAHRKARAEARPARPGPDTGDDGAARTEHDHAQSKAFAVAANMAAVPEQTMRDMTSIQAPARGKLDELRQLASHLTAGSLLQAATLQLIAEQENAPQRFAPARIAELSRQA